MGKKNKNAKKKKSPPRPSTTLAPAEEEEPERRTSFKDLSLDSETTNTLRTIETKPRLISPRSPNQPTVPSPSILKKPIPKQDHQKPEHKKPEPIKTTGFSAGDKYDTGFGCVEYISPISFKPYKGPPNQKQEFFGPTESEILKAKPPINKPLLSEKTDDYSEKNDEPITAYEAMMKGTHDEKVAKVTEEGLEIKEDLERKGMLSQRTRTSSALYLNKLTQGMDHQHIHVEEPRSNSTQGRRPSHPDDFVISPELGTTGSNRTEPRRTKPHIRVVSGSRPSSGRPAYQRQQSDGASSSMSSHMGTFSKGDYHGVPALVHKLRNGVKPTEVMCTTLSETTSRAGSSMLDTRSEDTRIYSNASGVFTGYYTPSMAGNKDVWDDGRHSIAFSTKTDFDLSGCEKFAEIETREQLPKSIPVKDNADEFMVDGQGTYSYDGRGHTLKRDILWKGTCSGWGKWDTQKTL